MSPEPAEANTHAHAPEGGLHKSALLGHRKGRNPGLDKPQTFHMKEKALEANQTIAQSPPDLTVIAETPTQPVQPVRKPKTTRTKLAKTEKKVATSSPKRASSSPKAVNNSSEPTLSEQATLQVLLQEITRLGEALATRPTWNDLRDLEIRLSQLLPQADQSQLMQAQELLRLREEELKELDSVVNEFQEKQKQASHQLQQLEIQLQDLRQQADQAMQRQYQAEGFLREALLSLLSPGDEFQEELVEQIQHFLQPE